MLNNLITYFNNYCNICDRKLYKTREHKTKLCKICLNNLTASNLRYKIINKSLDKTTSCNILYKLDKTCKELIYRYKFFKEVKLEKSITSLILESLNLNYNYDCIIGVPSHPLKKYKTGFWHLEFICKNIAKVLKIEHKICLKKSFFPLLEQKKLNKNLRIKSKNNIYCTANLKDKNILLIDDIITSGATIKKAIEALYLNEAKNISVIIFSLS